MVCSAAPATPLGTGDQLTAGLLELGAASVAAERVGGAAACLSQATEYAKVREQFGRPIGSFQAVKHRLADMLVEFEVCSSAVQDAALAVEQHRRDLPLAVAVAALASRDTYRRRGCTVALANVIDRRRNGRSAAHYHR
jgi:alkylation response protein AidB-like acyl-CoA dehydrogenase